MDILLNLAEGTGRMTNADKKHYITIFQKRRLLNA